MVGEKRWLNSQITNGTVIPGDRNVQPATHFMGRLRHMLNQPELPHLITEPDCMRAPRILKMNVKVARYNQLAVIGSKCFQQGGKLGKKCRGWRRRAGAVDGKQCQRTTGCSKRQAQSFVCSHANRQGGNLDPVDRLEVDDDSSVVLWRRPPASSVSSASRGKSQNEYPGGAALNTGTSAEEECHDSVTTRMSRS